MKQRCQVNTINLGALPPEYTTIFRSAKIEDHRSNQSKTDLHLVGEPTPEI